MRERPKPLKLGATGEFPRGKFDADDEGQLAFAIGVKDRTVLVDFGKPVARIGMSRDEAMAFAAGLIAYAERIT